MVCEFSHKDVRHLCYHGMNKHLLLDEFREETLESVQTILGVRRENDILRLPQVGRTLFNEAVSCIARSAPYLQCPTDKRNKIKVYGKHGRIEWGYRQNMVRTDTFKWIWGVYNFDVLHQNLMESVGKDGPGGPKDLPFSFEVLTIVSRSYTEHKKMSRKIKCITYL